MNIQRLVEDVQDEMIAFRRRIHQHPELSNQEYLTSQLIAEELKKMDIKVCQLGLQSGVVGLLQGNLPGPAIALRADIDALNLQEDTDECFASVNKGIAHACGHDIHTAVLLGCAKVLSGMREAIPGSIKFIFQPAEESLSGAKKMLQAAVLEDPDVKAIFALHCWPDLPAGTIGLKKGSFMAASDSLTITINGCAGHAAHPHRSIDPIMIAGHVITALQSIVSREIAPLDSAVITIGKITGGTAPNIIAPSVELSGTVRTLNPAVRAEMPDRIKRIVSHIAEGMRGTAKVEYAFGTPPVLNDAALVSLVETAVANILGAQTVTYLETASMGSEDFAFYLEKIPGVMLRLGTANANPASRLALHNPKLVFDETAIAPGIKAMCAVALEYLRNNKMRAE